jgi:hypothetical protein
MSSLPSIQGLFGNTVDALTARRNGKIVPKRLVLSSECYISFLEPGEKGNDLDLVQIDSISKTKRFIEKKNFKPYGHQDNIVLIDDAGWDIRISAKKTDRNLSKFIYLQELYLREFNNINKMKPLIEIKEKFLYNISQDGLVGLEEEYIYKDVSIVGFDEEIAGNAGEIRYNIQMFSPRRTITNETNIVPGKNASSPVISTDSFSKIINDLLDFNIQ